MSTEETIEGVLERIIYQNQENHYCIGELKTRSTSQAITIAGSLPGAQCGETLTLSGNWSNHASYGRQFKVKSFKSKLPATVHGIRKYLGSGLIDGIGKVYANKIVDHFGENTLKIISEESARLSEIPGIGKKRVKGIKAAWEKQKYVRDIMMFLQTYGVTNSQCLRVIKQFGEKTKELLKTEPYKLAEEIHGIGFKTADKIALNIGFSNESNERINAGILFAMKTLEDEGHTCFPNEHLVKYVTELLVVDSDFISSGIKRLSENQQLIELNNNHSFQLPVTHNHEKRIADKLTELISNDSTLPSIMTEKAVEWAENRAGFSFSPLQSAAIKNAIDSKVSIITGGPGTGKTTILRAVVDILHAKKVKTLLASPTGRAAQRLSEATGKYAQTVHRLLKFDPAKKQFTSNRENPLRCDFIIIDESSMLDNRLASALIDAIPNHAHFLLVGDIDQLPSVGCGNVLKDLIQCGKISVARLNDIFRQKADSSIISIAHSILAGKVTLPARSSNLEKIDFSNDINFVEATSPEKCVSFITELCKKTLPYALGLNAIKDIQIISPMHRGTAGTQNINAELQKSLNPRHEQLIAAGKVFKCGDKIIQMRNNYDKNVFNGDMGLITAIDTVNFSLHANFDNQTYEFTREDINDLQLAYCISVHKSQGSEYPTVIIPLLKQHYMMLQRNLIYTAITRGKRKVIIVGEVEAYALAVSNSKSKFRQTDLLNKINNHS